jgi:hypothetical protein
MKTLIVFLFAITSLSSFSYANAQPSLDMPTYNLKMFNKKCTLPAGTLILLEATETLDASQMTIGQLIQFKVRTDVKVDGQKLIATGAQAMGRVKNWSKGSYNHPGTVTIEITSVQAVDGQQIYMNGMEQTIKGRFKGQAATIQTGTAISAYVMNDVKVKR